MCCVFAVRCGFEGSNCNTKELAKWLLTAWVRGLILIITSWSYPYDKVELLKKLRYNYDNVSE